MIKQAYIAGVRAALLKLGLDDTSSSPYTMSFQQPTTSFEGQQNMIDQAFQTNANLGQPDGELTSATNNILQPGPPASPAALPRRFTNPTDLSGGIL